MFTLIVSVIPKLCIILWRIKVGKQTYDGKVPLILAFLQPYPNHLYPDYTSDELGKFATLGELQAGLARLPPTSCSTPGKSRPGGYNRNGKYLPAKYIASKTDKRAGK